MTSITTWIRLEPRSRDADMAPGIEARLHDPLWLLTRQWQLGELDGEDGGSAILARARYDIGRITGFAPHGGATVAVDPALPIAAVAEAAPRGAVRPIPNLATRARTGRHLVRLLARDGFADLGARAAAAFPIAIGPAEAAQLDAADRTLLAAVSGRAPDGVAFAAALRASLPALPPPLAAPAPAAVEIAVAWLAWYDALGIAAPGAGAWRSDHLEYAFGLRASIDGRAIELAVPEHHGAALGWSDVDLAAGGPSEHPPERGASTAVPAPVHYRGMPARRYWELEDGAVDWNAIDAAPGDLARMLLVDFALVFSDDWLLLPIELETGTLARVTSLVVTDTFGVRTRIEPASVIDPTWRMFGQGGDDGAAPLLLVHPRTPILDGPSEDEVVIAQDEQANLAWAIERAVTGADGRSRPIAAEPPATGHGYIVGRAVAAGWHPLRPVVDGGIRRLARAAIPGRERAALTALVADLAALAPEELAIGPVRLRTRHRLARRADGRIVLWRATVRDTVPRAGIPSSGLAFDQIDGESP